MSKGTRNTHCMYDMRVRLRVRVKQKEFITYVVWSYSWARTSLLDDDDDDDNNRNNYDKYLC